MAKKKLAFVDHNYHKKTRSGDFLREIFAKDFIIDDFWWSLKEENDLIKSLKKYDNIFFFQTLIPSYDLLKLKDKNLMWAPMYDNLSFDNNYWQKIKYINIKLLSFSKKIKTQADNFKCPNIELKYFFNFKENELKKPEEKINIFFWYRYDLGLNDWISFFDSKKVNKIVYFDSPDPGKKSEEIKKSKMEEYKIEIIKKSFLPHSEYIKFVKDCDVFVAPRKQEGIGMGFLEAISMGKYIISNDDSTMNEYILDEKIGFLINKNKSINYSNIINHSNYRMIFAKNGYLEWENKKNEILRFFEKKLVSVKKNLFIELLFLLDLIKYYLKKNLK
jgi:hypothetical protein